MGRGAIRSRRKGSGIGDLWFLRTLLFQVGVWTCRDAILGVEEAGDSFEVSPDGDAQKGLEKLGHQMCNEQKEVQDGIVRECGKLPVPEEGESRINEAEDVKNDHEGCLQQEQQQQQQLGPIIRWERFLPIKSIRILLVENDDSTRHVVSALLRICGYEVSAAANGLQAWKILEDLANHVDLVLTEVVMPYLSGIGLLSKIMSHKTCRNIPVIMMSSNDSMGIVFKCLSKGAVDFLVKPVRKNELKNLWQHVWRRCHSSSGSGSGSESGNQTQSSSEQQSANNADYCDSEDDDNESIKLNTRDGSDNGSGTQSSYTKQSVGIDSRQAISPSDPLTDPPNSTCAQVLQPNSEIFSKELGNMAMDRSCQAQNESTDESTGKDLGIEISRNSNMQCESNPTEIKNEGVVGVDPSNTFEDPTVHAADLIAPIAGNKDTQQAAGVTNAPSDSSNISKSRDDIYQGFIDSSLKRLRSTGENAISTQDSRNGLKHSDSSAFTRYHNSATSNKPLSDRWKLFTVRYGSELGR
ncbi:Two-component response regulator-like PRR73 [Ananas comosus]|uniref:Two-component response regulator-like PRR73 n=1 Tax=Ananas comosus TaxID=4615 RepID=A0A199UW54_ANACO|nr:Two-component response regulator-like PRR73 [Ananas comosus]